MLDPLATVTDALLQRTGRPAAGVWSAPGRVNLIGEHTDYNDGLCLPVALPLRAWVAATPREDDLLTVGSSAYPEPVTIRLGDIGPGRPSGWAAYVAGVLWALGEGGHRLPGMDLQVVSTVPLGAGLSSSAALECAIAIAASDLAGLGLGEGDAGRRELAAACVRAENDVAGAATGGMDQAISLRARQGHALLLDCRDGSVAHVPADVPGHAWLVTDTRAPHVLADGQYEARRRDCSAAARALGASSLREVADGASSVGSLADLDPGWTPTRRARHVVTEIARVRDVVVALQVGDVLGVGAALRASHASLREDFEVTVAPLDVAAASAQEAGALGARMTGGGFGGSTVALVPLASLDAVQEAVDTAFARRGWPAPVHHLVSAEGPARREA